MRVDRDDNYLPARPKSADAPAQPRIVVVAVNANTAFGGEAMLPWQYFHLLRRRGVDAHLVTHERNRDNLTAEAPDEVERLHFTVDRRFSRIVERAGARLPRNVKSMTLWVLMAAIAAIDLRRATKSICAATTGPVVVHEPVPVSPRQPSFIFDVGAPVVVGPLNGGMSYPPGFRSGVSKFERLTRWLARSVSDAANRVFNGKGKAAVVLVANARTRRALPRSVARTSIREMVENGVDLDTFTERRFGPTGPPHFAYIGRLVDWKRVDLLLRAFAEAPSHFRLEIVGDGPLRADLEAMASDLGIDARVTFRGPLSQPECAQVLAGCDALVLPSVYECGGAVVLEAMAVGLPVIATDWGGPADYVVQDVTGFLVTPEGPDYLVKHLAAAMLRLGHDRQLALRMGAAGRRRVEEVFGWEQKIDNITAIYREVLVLDTGREG
jgi:glycosyltransferase involved in cell wall biosynthesis